MNAHDIFVKSPTESFIINVYTQLVVHMSDRYGTAQNVRGLEISQAIRLEQVCLLGAHASYLLEAETRTFCNMTYAYRLIS